MAILEIAKIQVRRGEERVTGIPQLDPGEFGWAQDTEHLYIGKRISEGAKDDNNTRILTENDQATIIDNLGTTLRSFLSTSTVASTATYKYRVSDTHILSNTSSISIKLDNAVSLTDYLPIGLLISHTPVDITATLTAAIQNLFNNNTYNSWQRVDARRKLIIPAGNYLISSTIELPPYTSLVGEGQEITTLSLTTGTVNMFRTVDAQGNDWADGMSDGVKRSREISIENMTLQYLNVQTTATARALLSLDNVLDAKIEDVFFKTAIDVATTTTYGLVDGGIGISIRGQGGGIAAGDVNLCENIHINRCRFDSLYTGIVCTGTVVRPVLTNSVLSNLNRGLTLYPIDSLLGPTNGLFSNNRFKSIVREAIWVGTSTNKSMHVSENNYFIQVGNGTNLDDNNTTSTNSTAVILFYSEGNKTINDYFHRRIIADSTTNPNFYYNPLVTGRVIIDDSATISSYISSSTTFNNGITQLTKIPLTGLDQMVTVKYQLSNDYISRKGNIIINIASDNFTSMTDTYNFTSNEQIVDGSVTTATTATIVPGTTQFLVNYVNHPAFVQVAGGLPFSGTGKLTDQTWFMVDPNNGNNAALITSFTTSSGNVAMFDTQSFPVVNFNTSTSFILARSISTPIILNVDYQTYANKNYVVLTAKNSSTATESIAFVEYNVNILQ
jgi:hypothetical protein